MCNLETVTNYLIAAKVACIAIVVSLGIAIALSSSFFAAAGNAAVMVIAIVSAGLATAAYIRALTELDKCGDSCVDKFGRLRGALILQLTTMAAMTALLIALAAVASIPFAGAAAAATVLGVFITFTLGAAIFLEVEFLIAGAEYNHCRTVAALSKIGWGAFFFSVLLIIVLVVFLVATVATGSIPVAWPGK